MLLKLELCIVIVLANTVVLLFDNIIVDFHKGTEIVNCMLFLLKFELKFCPKLPAEHK